MAKNELKKEKKEEIVSPSKVIWRRLKKNKVAIVGLGLLIFMVLFSFVGPFLSPYKLGTMDFNNSLVGPTLQHPFGTDMLGRDILTRVMYGGRISILVGIVAVIIEIIVGSILGAISGFYGGIVDGIIMRIVDIFLCLPFLPVLITIGAVLSDLKVNASFRLFIVMFSIGILDWPGMCRLIRGQILSLREQEYMQAAEALGLRDRRKIFNHLLPNTYPMIIVSATMSVGAAILSESSLSFLGLGVIPPTPSWGNMIQAVNDLYALKHQAWLWVPPGLCILATVMAINLFGDGLRDALDPKLKQ